MRAQIYIFLAKCTNIYMYFFVLMTKEAMTLLQLPYQLANLFFTSIGQDLTQMAE